MVHKDVKTANVLVDENFIAKVADAGLRNFLGRVNNIAGPSSQVTADEIFLAPEYCCFLPAMFSDNVIFLNLSCSVHITDFTNAG